MQDSIQEPLAIILIILMLFLLIVIGILGNVLLGAVTWFRQKEKEVEQKSKTSGGVTAATLVIGFLMAALPASAQDGETVVESVTSYGGLSPDAFWFMMGVIGVELLVIFVMLLQLRLLVAKQKAKAEGLAEEETSFKASFKKYWQKLNKFRPVEQEADLDMGHEYDGIRELDNRLPPWWLYGFYFTIIFAVIYLWRYHVSESAPLSAQEYEIAVRKAEQQRAEYLKKTASLVDENTVKLLTDASDLAAGKKTFDQNCSPCHGNLGEGNIVGPNLTDDYWLHGGSLSDIFKSIKYGWPEKGMRAWKDDLTPAQIAQLASYIKSLRGTNPPNAKEKQGELYVEEESGGAQADSTSQTAAQ